LHEMIGITRNINHPGNQNDDKDRGKCCKDL